MKHLETLEDIKKFVNFVVGSKGKHPAVLKACGELGIDVQELFPKRFEEMEDKSAGKEVNELRFAHFEARRKAKVNIICEFLIDHKIFQVKTREINKKITLTPQNRTHNPSELTSASQELSISHRERVLKSKIVHQLLVEENLKRLKVEEEAQKTQIEQKIREKESREGQKIRNTRLFEIRDKRIKERLLKKQKDIDKHEEQALKMFQNSQIQLKTQYSVYTPTHKHIESENDADIQEKLEIIHNKLNSSAARAKKLLLKKVNSSHSVTTQLARIKSVRDQIMNKEAEEYGQKVVKIQQELEFSNVINKKLRRLEKLKEVKKLSKSVVHTLDKKVKDEGILYEKMKKQEEEKEFLIEKVRKEAKEGKEQRSCFVGMKRKLRKKDQEENLKRIHMQKVKERTKWLERLKESEGVKTKPDIDVEKIRALAVEEVKNRLKLETE